MTLVMILQQPSVVMIPVKNTKLLKFDTVKTAADILNRLRATLPSWSPFFLSTGRYLGSWNSPSSGIMFTSYLGKIFSQHTLEDQG